MSWIIPRNEHALFLHINQGDNPLTRYACTIYSMCINLKYNTWIEIPEPDIEFIVQRQIDRWLLWLKTGGYWTDARDAVLEFIRENPERYPVIPKVVTFNRDDSKFNYFLNMWYCLVVWIAVNKDFTNDIIDWKLDKFEDYVNYKGDLRHYTNIWIWKARFTEPKPESYGREFNLDSYFKHRNTEWMRGINISKMREDLLQNSCHCFYLEK